MSDQRTQGQGPGDAPPGVGPAHERSPGAPAPHVPMPAEAAELSEVSGVWQLAWPTMTAFALQSVVGFVDMLFVAELGTHAVAGVGIGSQLHFVAFALFAAITTGTVAVVARVWGAGERAEADRQLQITLILTVIAGLALTVCAPLAPAMLSLFPATPEVSHTASSYLRILLLASMPLGVGIALSSAMRAAGDVRSPLIIGVFGNLLNILLDYVLIFGHWGAPALGTDGSAIASALSFTIATGVYVAFWLGNQLLIPRGPLIRRLPVDDCLRLLRIGLPTALEHLAFNAGFFLFLRLVTGFGTESVSAYMIGVRILAFSFIPGMGFATAASTLVGQHLGARRPDEAAAACWRATGAGIAVMTSIGLTIVIFAESISGWFGAAGSETTRLTVIFIYVLAVVQPLMAIEFTVSGALRGAGDTRFPLLAVMTGLFVVRLGTALLLLRFFEPTVVQVWCCLIGDYFVKALLLAGRFYRGRWKTLEI